MANTKNVSYRIDDLSGNCLMSGQASDRAEADRAIADFIRDNVGDVNKISVHNSARPYKAQEAIICPESMAFYANCPVCDTQLTSGHGTENFYADDYCKGETTGYCSKCDEGFAIPDLSEYHLIRKIGFERIDTCPDCGDVLGTVEVTLHDTDGNGIEFDVKQCGTCGHTIYN